jgi:dihydropyrimidine dehydrogenase (NAD+) subunit PreA
LDIHEASPRFSALYGDGGNIMGFKNIEQLSDHSAAENMEVFRRLKAKYPKKFILASIMGQNDEEWRTLAHLCQENGADAVELNFSCPNMAEGGMGSDIGQVPELVERFTAAAKSFCTIPVLAKLTPNVASMNPAAEAALRGGADGIAANIVAATAAIQKISPSTDTDQLITAPQKASASRSADDAGAITHG